MGEVTWVQDGQLRALADGASPTCLLDVVAGKGTATTAVDPATHRLIRHGSDGAVSDISFLDSTDEAIYHPGGTRIIAVGTDAGCRYGIWLSSTLEQPAVAWSIGPCDTTGTVLMSSLILSQPADLRTMAGSPFVDQDVTLQPVGWLSGYRLALAARPSGCDGPADLWIWSTVDGFHHIAHGALAPAVRLPRGEYRDLPDRPSCPWLMTSRAARSGSSGQIQHSTSWTNGLSDGR